MPVANAENCRKNIPKWLGMGYEVVLLQDRFEFDVPGAKIVRMPDKQYLGWPKSVNHLVKNVIDPEVGIVVAAGDDMTPDPAHRAQEIARAYWERFPDGFGILQPIGDDLDGTDRICGSPWMGRSWLDNAYLGNGPMCGEYFQFYADEELLNVSRLLGVLWQEPLFTQYHDHWTRKGENRPHYQDLSQNHWESDKAIFERRKAAGFPGHEKAGAG